MNEEHWMLKQFCDNLAEKLAQSFNQNTKETISEEKAFLAMAIVMNMRITEAGDALLYAAAINLLDVYRTQSEENEAQVGSSYHQKAELLCKTQTNTPCEFVSIELQPKKKDYRMIYQMSALQIVFDYITSSKSTEPYIVTDAEQCTLTLDALNKQYCADTLYEAALENPYARTNCTLDGTDLDEALSMLQADFQSGVKGFEDVRHSIDFQKEKEDNPGVDSQTASQNIDGLSFMNYSVYTLYQGDYHSFREAVKQRQMVPYIAGKAEEENGFSISTEIRCEWKYALETVSALFDRKEINPELGIRIDIVKGRRDDHLVLIMCAQNEDEVVGSVITLLSWDTARIISADGMVEYTDHDCNLPLSDWHPSKQTIEYVSLIGHNLFRQEKCRFFPCVYFYDAARKSTTDISEGLPLSTLAYSPCFYAAEEEDLIEYLSPPVAYGNGKEALGRLINSDNSSQKGSTRGDLMLAAEWVQANLIMNNSVLAFMMIRFCKTGVPAEKEIERIVIDSFRDGPPSEKASAILEKFGLSSEQLEVSRQNIEEFLSTDTENNDKRTMGDLADSLQGKLKIYLGRLPEQEELNRWPISIVYLDPYELTLSDISAITELQEVAKANGILNGCFYLPTALGFSDIGGGNDLLIKLFNLGLTNAQNWHPETYQLSVVDSEAEFSKEEGIANVVVDSSVTLKLLSDGCWAGDATRVKLYHEVASGPRGVCMLIEDEDLRDSVRTELNDREKQVERTKQYMQSTENMTEWSELVRVATASDSSVYNRYQDFAVECIGRFAWSKMSSDSRDWVVSSLISFDDMRHYDTLMDFSGVDLMISKAFEVEMAERLVTQYEDWAQKKYGSDYIDMMPEELKKIQSDGTIALKTANDTTLGDMPYVMGLDSRGKLHNQTEYDNFVVYAEEHLLYGNVDIGTTLKEMVKIENHVRTKYRNPSAHKCTIDVVGAKDCLDYSVVEERKLGVLMDMYRQ